MHDAVVGFIGKTAREDAVDISLHYRWHRKPPEWIDDCNGISGANVILRLSLAVPEFFQFRCVGARQRNSEAVFRRMSNDKEMLHMTTI